MHNNNHFMSMPILILFISLTLSFLPLSFSTPYIHSLNKGSSLSVEKPDQVLISPNGVFSAGFHSVGDNAYCFAIWFSEPLYDGRHTIVWMANRDQPINGRLSKLSLLQNGNLILTDAGQLNVWATGTESISPVQLLLNGTGNLVLLTSEDPWLNNWETLRSSYNDNRTAVLNSSGHFKSTDNFEFTDVDSGIGTQRRLTMDYDGNIRLYSLDKIGKIWSVSWQAIQKPCNIHGICGPNSLCTYVPLEKFGRRCYCIPGYKIKSHTDPSLGCEPEFSLSCSDGEAGFLGLPHVEFYGYDITFYSNYTFKMCEEKCLQRCDCYGFQYRFHWGDGVYNCYTKSLLLNGYRSTGFPDPMYIKLPKVTLKSYTNHVQGFSSDCPQSVSLQLNRIYKKPQENETLQFLVWFASAIGGVEIICVCLVFCFLYRTRPDSVATTQSYLQIATGFRKFTYREMEQRHLVKWVREKMNETVAKESWLEEIIDPVMKGRYDASKMETLVGVALQCVEENKDARPTMSQVVERLVHHEPSDY
ncbi:putative receptor protein kinase ZmPK1 [Camellia lanceoleosa]|uniref:Receptor protein kinase ZmPK1 n=1 Tax=Camellia lanceoleosa TaxID=1840588 RepID=A0ACC0IYG0_9ERIC|nr:putative receptor protein kinase ZmPK1 [Camellia lanceoleosa]